MRKNPDGPITLPIHAGDLEARVRALELVSIPDVDPPDPVYAVYAKMTGGQSLANNALPSIVFTAVLYDYGGWIDLGVDATLFTVPVDGFYTVWAQYEWNSPASSAERREAQIDLQGDPYNIGAVARENTPTISGIPTSQNVVLSRRLVAGSTLKAKALQASGGAFTIGTVNFAVTLVAKA